MNKIDNGVATVVLTLLGCVLVKAALDAAVTIIVPVVVAGLLYAAFRAWQKGWFAKFIPEKQKKEGS